jgi:TRAP-type C4-dicarboxylate transport system permease small subunit
MVAINSKTTKMFMAVNKVMDIIMQIVEKIGSLMLSLMVIIITWQVTSRMLSITAAWTEEIAIILLVWFGMFGAANGVRKGSHIGVEFIYSLLPKKVQKFINIVTNLLIFIFAFFILFEGVNLAKGCWTIQMPATLLSRGKFVYLAIPSASVLMMFYSLENIFNLLNKGDGGTRE